MVKQGPSFAKINLIRPSGITRIRVDLSARTYSKSPAAPFLAGGNDRAEQLVDRVEEGLEQVDDRLNDRSDRREGGLEAFGKPGKERL